MSTTLFVMPIKKGQTEAFKNFMAECLGPKKKEYADLLMRYGLNNCTMWTHTLQGIDYAMFTHDMDDDAAEKLNQWPDANHPFDIWFDQNLKACYDFEALEKMPMAQPTLFCAFEASH